MMYNTTSTDYVKTMMTITSYWIDEEEEMEDDVMTKLNTRKSY